eukprot:EG_transcript_4806
MPDPDAAYVAQFGDWMDWNALHDGNDWQQLTNDQVAASDAVQRCHFSAFFCAAHKTRYPLSPTRSLGRTMRAVRDCFVRWKTDWIWLHLRRALRTRVLLKRHVRALSSAARQHRTATLEGWLSYWREAETKAQHEVRAKLRSGKPLTADWAGPTAWAQVMTATCEEVKAQVLWELYWLLLAQASIAKHSYWMRWRALQRQRQKLLWAQQVPADPTALDSKPTLDFWNNEPVSLRGIDAALFVLALQAPRFRYRAGEEVTLRELVRLANAPQPVFRPHEVDVRLRHASGVVTAFLDSPLCREAAWLRRRFARSLPLIPPRTWRLESSPSPAVTFSPKPPDRDAPAGVPAAEERSSLFQQRRLGDFPASLSAPTASPSPLRRHPPHFLSPCPASAGRGRSSSAGRRPASSAPAPTSIPNPPPTRPASHRTGSMPEVSCPASASPFCPPAKPVLKAPPRTLTPPRAAPVAVLLAHPEPGLARRLHPAALPSTTPAPTTAATTTATCRVRDSSLPRISLPPLRF